MLAQPTFDVLLLLLLMLLLMAVDGGRRFRRNPDSSRPHVAFKTQ